MSNSYLIKITQKQIIYTAIEKADSAQEAIELACSQQGEITALCPAEVEEMKAEVVRGCNSE